MTITISLIAGIVFAYGQTWVDMRSYTKKLLREYGYGKVKIIEKSLNESANQLVNVIKSGLLDSTDGTLAVKTSTFSIHVLNIVWDMVGGYRFEPTYEPLTKAIKCLDRAVEVYGTGNIYNMLPFLRTWFPKLVNHPEHLKIHDEIHAFAKVESS